MIRLEWLRFISGRVYRGGDDEAGVVGFVV